MESFDFINGWDRFIVFVCLVVMVREVVVMFVVCKEKRWFMLIWLNCCIVVIIKFVFWYLKFELIWFKSVIRWFLYV